MKKYILATVLLLIAVVAVRFSWLDGRSSVKAPISSAEGVASPGGNYGNSVVVAGQGGNHPTAEGLEVQYVVGSGGQAYVRDLPSGVNHFSYGTDIECFYMYNEVGPAISCVR